VRELGWDATGKDMKTAKKERLALKGKKGENLGVGDQREKGGTL